MDYYYASTAAVARADAARTRTRSLSRTNSESVTVSSPQPHSNRVSTSSSSSSSSSSLNPPTIPARSPLRPPTRAKSLSVSTTHSRSSLSLKTNIGTRLRTSFTPTNDDSFNYNYRDSRSTDSPNTPRTPVTPLDTQVLSIYPLEEMNRETLGRDSRDSLPSLDELLATVGLEPSSSASAAHGHPLHSHSHPHFSMQRSDSDSYPHSHMLSSSDDSSATIMPPGFNSAEFAGSGYRALGKALPARPDSPVSDGDPDHRDRHQEEEVIQQERRRPRRTNTSNTMNSAKTQETRSSADSSRSGVASTLFTTLPASASATNVTVIAPTAPPTPAGPSMTKRQHALHELLSSERAYASDLVLIRDIHVPLALGLTIPLSNISLPASPPNSSGSSSRTLSTASDSSNTSNPNAKANGANTNDINSKSNTNVNASANAPNPDNGPPMTPEDTKMIFGNIAEIALFADMFTEEIEAALGKEVEGGEGDDRLGELFLRIAPELERPYKQYITRHPTALAHLHALPSTPALQSYLTYTQTIASSLSHAWDLASLLIKPVQRLLKYPLLLGAIIDETPDDHSDKERLIEARKKMEEVARNVNEGRRRAEVVKDVLSGGGVGASNKAKKSSGAGGSGGSGGVGVGVAASVNLSKMKSLRHGGVTAATMRVSALSEGGNSEAAQVEAYQNELKRLDAFAQVFAKSIVDWGRMTSNMMGGLRMWSTSFGKVIGLSSEQSSEAFDAFVEVVQRTLLPLAVDLENVINERVLKDLAHLLETMSKPFKLMRSMDEQEPYHYHLLTMPVSAKNRPPPALLEASQNYLALRGQLAAELPTYITLLHRGLASLVRRLADIQVRFWRDVKERWGELWEMLRVEGELNAGWEETTAVWWGRWVDVDGCIAGLGVCNNVKDSLGKWVREKEERDMRERLEREATKEKEMRTMAAMVGSSMSFAGGIGGMMVPVTPPQSQPLKRSSRGSSGSGQQQLGFNPNASMMSMQGGKAAAVYSMMGALEPTLSGRKERPAALPLGSVGNGMSMTPAMPSPPSTTTAFPVSAPLPMSVGQMYVHAKNRSRDVGDGVRGKRVSNEGANPQVGGAVKNVIRKLSSQDSMRHSREVHQGHVPRRSRDDTKSQQQKRRTQGYGQAVSMAEDFADYMSQNHQSQSHQGQQGGQYNISGGFEYPVAGPSSFTPSTSPPRPAIPRTKSMPLSDKSSTSTNATTVPVPAYASGPILPGGSAYYYEDEYDQNSHSYSGPYQQQQQVQPPPQHRHELRRSGSSKQRDIGGNMSAKERGRRPSAEKNQPHTAPPATTAQDPSPPRRQSKSKEKFQAQEKESQSRERPTHARKRSGSVKSITSFFSSPRDSGPSTHQDQTLTPSQRDSWVSKPAKYICQVIHPCKPPASVSYYSFPFFTLQEGDLYEVLQEAGHPSIHPKLPLYVDDGEDCLLLCRDERGTVGWALASFLEPVLGA
ncbi:hypothetical protein CPB83DRAFT_852143 [Crepidotus variabilis]|uniref:DH domain-containing protein n=1 Tax=Crepidotus variabilis TaxID=179855 RepID=A0A9P6EHI6_9AGAR|nr:hypothetical protein CPB83DRAFT_852143 [Crepidotus variabilis]